MSITSKEQAEIELIQAQTQKLASEATPSLSLKLTELIKVVGSLILGAGGVVAAITGYQMSEVKNARLGLEYEQKQAALGELNKQYQQRQGDYEKLSEALKKLSADLEARQTATALATASVESTQKQLIELRAEVQRAGTPLSASSSAKLQKAIDETQHAQDVTKAGNEAFAISRAEIQRLSQQQQQASLKLNQVNLKAQQTMGRAKLE